MTYNPVIAGDALTGAVRTAFLDTYAARYKGIEARLSKVMKLAVPSDKLTERYVYFESAPHPKRQPRGQEISTGSFRSRSFTVTNHDWSKMIEWHENDEADDQTGGGLVRQARMVGGNFALLHERVYWQLQLGTTDADLLPAIPNAPDGAALYSATGGDGAARFGATNGNLLGGGGVATSAAVRTDLWKAVAQWRLFKDTTPEAQPLLQPEQIRSFVIEYNAQNDEVFREAFKQPITLKALMNVAGAENVAAAGVSNTILDAAIEIDLRPTQRVTDNDWFIKLVGVDHDSIFEQSRSPLEEILQTKQNSDIARRTGMVGIGWKSRSGYGIALPWDRIKINN